MAHEVKCLPCKPDDLDSVPESTEGRRSNPQGCPLVSTCIGMLVLPYTLHISALTHNNNKLWKGCRMTVSVFKGFACSYVMKSPERPERIHFHPRPERIHFHPSVPFFRLFPRLQTDR